MWDATNSWNSPHGAYSFNSQLSTHFHPEAAVAARLNLDTNTSRQVPKDPELEEADGTVIEITRAMREKFVRESGRLYAQSLLRNEADIRRAYEQGGAGAAQKIVSNISSKANKEAKGGL